MIVVNYLFIKNWSAIMYSSDEIEKCTESGGN